MGLGPVVSQEQGRRGSGALSSEAFPGPERVVDPGPVVPAGAGPVWLRGSVIGGISGPERNVGFGRSSRQEQGQ